MRPAISIATALSFVSRKPSSLRFDLTNHCNHPCNMCGICAAKPSETVDPATYDEVLWEPILSRFRLVSVTGGEPFLLDDFEEYCRSARRVRPRAHVNVSSNGYYTDRTIDFFAKADPGTASLTI